jgi:hypothetical protein
MLLVTQIYNTLKQAQLVSTLEEYSTQWLNKHKTTASYLIHKKRDLSLNAKISCLKNIKIKINEFEFGNRLTQDMQYYTLASLKNLQSYITDKIKEDFKIELIIY